MGAIDCIYNEGVARSRKQPAAATPPDPRADVAALRAFLAVARLGSVGRAAELLGRTQPSISARIAGLEQAWGTRLFRRIARGMAVTPEGARLLPMAESALRSLEELDRAAGAPVAESDELRVGAGDSLGRRLLPRALAQLLERRPALEVRVVEGPGHRLVQSLRDGEIDVALAVASTVPTPPDGLDVEPIVTSGIDMIEAGPGRRGNRLPLRRLAGRRIVTLQAGSGFRRHLEAAFAASDLPFHPAVEVGNLSLVRRFVAAGLGVAIVPAVAFGDEDLDGLTRRRLSGVPPVEYVRILRDGAPLSTATADLLELLRADAG
jgi:LysR family cyn operon transcriptional activator